MEIFFNTVFVGKLQKLHLFKNSSPETFYKQGVLKNFQNSLENTCVRVSCVIVLWAVASVPSHEYTKDKIVTHALAFLSSNSFFSAFFHSILIFPLKFYIVFTLWCWYQKCIQNPTKHLKFVKIIKGLRPLTFAKNYVLDI